MEDGASAREGFREVRYLAENISLFSANSPSQSFICGRHRSLKQNVVVCCRVQGVEDMLTRFLSLCNTDQFHSIDYSQSRSSP